MGTLPECSAVLSEVTGTALQTWIMTMDTHCSPSLLTTCWISCGALIVAICESIPAANQQSSPLTHPALCSPAEAAVLSPPEVSNGRSRSH